MRVGIAFFFLLIIGSNRLIGQSNQPEEIYNELLSKYVSSNGNVNYKGFIRDKERFQIYLDYLSSNKPKVNESKNVKLA